MDIVSERKIQWGVEEFKSSVFISTDDVMRSFVRSWKAILKCSII